jgi:hypothetical protein
LNTLRDFLTFFPGITTLLRQEIPRIYGIPLKTFKVRDTSPETGPKGHLFRVLGALCQSGCWRHGTLNNGEGGNCASQQRHGFITDKWGWQCICPLGGYMICAKMVYWSTRNSQGRNRLHSELVKKDRDFRIANNSFYPIYSPKIFSHAFKMFSPCLFSDSFIHM